MNIKRKGIKGVITLFITMCCMLCCTAISAFAVDHNGTQSDMAKAVAAAEGLTGTLEYTKKDGGVIPYKEMFIWSDDGTTTEGILSENNVKSLTSSELNRFLEDAVEASNNYQEACGNKASTKVQDNWLKSIQNTDGVGSQLMNTILKNTKPDYATANKIYEPFSGVVGTVLALGSILIMAFLGITMVLDLSYIGIPAFRMMLDGGEEGKQGSKPKFISHEAVSAVQEAEGNGGGGGQNGSSNKVAVGIYFKRRVIMLIVLGICLLYLIQGQIFTLVSWILNLVSGFFGF